MRDIKFRSFNNQENTFYYFFDGMYFSKGLNNIYIECDKSLFSWHNAEQYTVLKDKNSVEIYDGDIVKTVNYARTEFIGSIIFCEINGMFVVENKINDDIGLYFAMSYDTYLEVIGNIHENKELLKQEVK